MGLLDGKKLLVTGVLTDGSIAFHVARLAQQEGAEVLLTSFGRQFRLTQAIARRLPKEAQVLQLDVTDSDDLAALEGRVREAELAAERGEQHLRPLLLREARHVEGDRAVREDAGDQECLAVEQTHVRSVL